MIMQINLKRHWVIYFFLITIISCGKHNLAPEAVFCDTFVKNDRDSRFSEFLFDGKSIEALVIKKYAGDESDSENGRLTAGESIVSDEIKIEDGTIWIGADHSNISKDEVGLFFTAEGTNIAELIYPGSFDRIVKFDEEFYVISNTLDSHGGGDGIISIFGHANNIFFLKEVIKTIDVKYEDLQIIDGSLVISGYFYRNDGGFAKRLNGIYLTCTKNSRFET